MVKNLKDNFQKGIAKIRLFAFYFSERLKIEVAVMKLLFQSDEISKKKDEILKTIGQRVLDMKDQGDKDILKDKQVLEALEEIAKVEKDITDLKARIQELSKVTGP